MCLTLLTVCRNTADGVSNTADGVFKTAAGSREHAPRAQAARNAQEVRQHAPGGLAFLFLFFFILSSLELSDTQVYEP